MRKRRILLIILFFSFISFLFAQGKEDFFIAAGGQKSITFDGKITKVAIGDPAIAHVRATSAYELLITGKKEGTTSLIVWVGANKIIKQIIVSNVDLERALKEIKEKLKKTKGVNANIKDGKIALEGTIANNDDVAIVEEIIVKNGDVVVNFVALPVQMIKIEARVVEMGANDSSTIGINWRKKFEFVESKIEGIYQLGRIDRATKIDAVLDFMAQEGKAKIVAKPNIIVINGRTATFHSGGTLLIPLINQTSSSVQEKQYGVDLKILPFGDRKANLVRTSVDVEVSTLDYKNGIKTGEGTIPAISDRNISTEIDVKIGKTIVIAGMLMEEEQIVENKVPILGHIPLLGLLFSSKDVLKTKTELVIFLTPSFVNFVGEEIIE